MQNKDIRIGVIAEGKGDIAVIETIVEAVCGLEIVSLPPSLRFDATRKNDPEYIREYNEGTHGGKSRIKTYCEEGTEFKKFAAVNPDAHIIFILHLDTAEIEENPYWGIHRPLKPQAKDKLDEYAEQLCAAVIEKMKEWLNGHLDNYQFIFAIAVEEIDAWVLTLYENTNTVKYGDPKERLDRIPKKLSKDEKNELSISEARKMSVLSKNFKELKNIKKGEIYLNRNISLRRFCESLLPYKKSEA